MKKNAFFDAQELQNILIQANRPLHLDDILRIGRYSRKIKGEILSCLQDLAYSGFALRIKGGGWVAEQNLKTCRGRLVSQRSGSALVAVEGDYASSIYIAPEHVNEAWNGDLVEIVILPGKQGLSGRKEGRVSAVIEKNCSSLAARVLSRAGRHRFLCRPADTRMTFDLMVNTDSLDHEPHPFELLIVIPEKPLIHDKGSIIWEGKATGYLGKESEANVQEKLVKLAYRIPEAFPDNVSAEAEQAAACPSLDSLADLRNELLVTIDGEDARDFDDAVCVRRMHENWHLMVAIADVSHYVKPGSALDREARERGNSFYFPLSVEPMLPEALCNGACSLRPGEERRCLAVDMLLDRNGNFLETRFINGVMISRARLTYSQTQAVLDDRDCETARQMEKNAPGIPAMLFDAAELASILIRRRKQRGGLDFDLPEAEFAVASNNGEQTVSDIHTRKRLFSHRLIEAFMIRANEAIAEFLSKRAAPFLYRVHPEPDPDRLEALSSALREVCPEMNNQLPVNSKDPGWLSRLLDEASQSSQGSVVSNLALRSMTQARYDIKKDRHFGLASECYCHFTSPIRRYADLENHRALKHALDLAPHGPEIKELEECAEQCNRQERVATAAEREINRRMGCLLLRPHAGEIFDGVISGVTSFGFFVEFNTMPVEGMVKVETLPPDWYDYDGDGIRLCGIQSGRIFRLGQPVSVKLAGVNLDRLEINLEYLEKENGMEVHHKKRSNKQNENRRDGGRRGFAFRSQRQRREGGRKRELGQDSWESRSDSPRRDDGLSNNHRYSWAEERRSGDSSFAGERHEFSKGRRGKQQSFRSGEERRFSERPARDYVKFTDRRSRPHEDDALDYSGNRPFRKMADEHAKRENRHQEHHKQGLKKFSRRGGRFWDRDDSPRTAQKIFSAKKHERRDAEDFGASDHHTAGHSDLHRTGRETFRSDERRPHAYRPYDHESPKKDYGRNRHSHHEARKKTTGMPEDFFRIELEDDGKSVFRFGKRKK
ncbi:MAG: VacB/RNase II family 3'-5' exoribonuclease [Mailhella sp.]|nr:VacB/RNase II family 3'-5' exoribonuclease [Mailhella sp.]